MIRHEERVEAGLLRDSWAGANRRAVGLRTHVADCDSEFHCDYSGDVTNTEVTPLTLTAITNTQETPLTLKQDWQARAHPVKLLGHWRRQSAGRPSAKQRNPYNLHAIPDVAVRRFCARPSHAPSARPPSAA